MAAWVYCTLQTFSFCTSRPDVSLCLVVQTPIDKMSKYRRNTSITQVACEKSYFQLSGHLCIHAEETEWQSRVRSCIMPGLPTHLVQELNVGTVCLPIPCK